MKELFIALLQNKAFRITGICTLIGFILMLTPIAPLGSVLLLFGGLGATISATTAAAKATSGGWIAKIKSGGGMGCATAFAAFIILLVSAILSPSVKNYTPEMQTPDAPQSVVSSSVTSSETMSSAAPEKQTESDQLKSTASKTKSKAASKAVSKVESKAESKTESKAESKVASKTESKAESKVASKTESKTESKAVSKAESKKSESKVESKNDTESTDSNLLSARILGKETATTQSYLMIVDIRDNTLHTMECPDVDDIPAYKWTSVAAYADDIPSLIKLGEENGYKFCPHCKDEIKTYEEWFYGSLLTDESSEETTSEKVLNSYTFVLNTNSNKIHFDDCQAVPKINPENRSEVTYQAYSLGEAVKMAIADGYDTCGFCTADFA